MSLNDPAQRSDQICFYDIETTTEGDKEIIEFGAVVVDKKGWFEISSFSTLLNADAKVSPLSVKINGITSAMLKGAPAFAEAADRIYDVLHGRMWAGHNIVAFDNVHISKAFEKLGRQAPVSAGHLDTLKLLKPTFGKRAGSLKLADLATYFGLGAEKHRALDDARLCFDVVKLAATTLFFEQHVPTHFTVPVVATEAKAKVEKVQKKDEVAEAKQPAPAAAAEKEKKEKKPRNKKNKESKENKDAAPATVATVAPVSPVATQLEVAAPAVAVVAEAKKHETVTAAATPASAPVAASSASTSSSAPVPKAWTGKSYSTVLASAPLYVAPAPAASPASPPASSGTASATTTAEAKESKSPKEKKEKKEKKDGGKDKEKRVRKSKKERAQNSQNSQSSEEEDGWISILPKRDLKGHNANGKKPFNKDEKKEARANFKRMESLASELDKAMSEGKSLFVAYDGGRTAATDDKPVGVRELLPVKWEARPYKFQAVPLPRRESKDKKKEGEEKEEVLLSFATKKIVQLRSEPFTMTPGQPTVAAPKPAYVPPVWPGKPVTVAASSQ